MSITIKTPLTREAVRTLKAGDTLVVCKLDRFARNTAEGLNVIQHLLERGVKVNILNMGTIDTTPTGKLILTVMLAFAEFERDMIVQRTTEGKAIARTKDNFVEGRPPKYDEETTAKALRIADEFGLLYSGGSDYHGINKPDIAMGTGRGNLRIPTPWLEQLKRRKSGKKE